MGDWSFAGGMRAHPDLRARYDILERLGEGTYGEVYKGKRKLDGLIVALKETRDPQCASREAEALLALDHPNIVQLIEYFAQGPNLILVLEFLPSDLYQVIQASDRRIREAEVKGWMLQLLRGVGACHQASLLHRDLKPSNLLVAANGTLKVADFGQARVVRVEGADSSGIRGIHLDGDNSTDDVEKEDINSWIKGTREVKSSVEPVVKETRSEARAVIIVTEEGLKENVGESVEHGCGRCFCIQSDDINSQESGNIGCRSVNCSMVKREGLIVARSNHFVDMEQNIGATTKPVRDEELGRREWVLAEKNMVVPPQEKDSDFFYKLRSFLKRRGRKAHKQRMWGKDKGDVKTSQIILEEGLCADPDMDTILLHQTVHDVASVPGYLSISQLRGDLEMWTANISLKKTDFSEADVDNMDVGIRPLMENESSEEKILFRALDTPGSCVLEKNSKRSTSDLKESLHTYIYKPVVENPFDGTYVTQSFGDSGRLIINSSSGYSHGGRDDMGSDSKRRKAYELEKGTEESTFTGQSPSVRGKAGEYEIKLNNSLSNLDEPSTMETDTPSTELEAVRMRILSCKHRKTDPECGESLSLQSGNSMNVMGHFELPSESSTPIMSIVPLENIRSKSTDVKLEAEETEKAVQVLGLERLQNGVEGYVREVECAQEGTAPCVPENETATRFWDGNRRKWESADEASDDERRLEDHENAKWYDGGMGHNRKELHGSFYDDGSYGVNRLARYYTYGETDIEDCDQEDGDSTGQTQWFRPPDVHDSYVKHKLEGHKDSCQNENTCHCFGGDSRQYDDERLQETEVHSQQEETESKCTDESWSKGSDLSSFVGTRWYKAPELLYGATKYGKGLDMWAIGCIFAELLSGKPLFPGITDIDQLSLIVRVLGAANENVWPGVSLLPDFDKISFSDERPLLSFRNLIPQASASAVKFLEKLLVYDPERRLGTEAALRDIYFLEDPLPALPQELKVPSFRRESSASEEWGEWRDPGSPFSDFEILDSTP